jgi:hypothetical protein
MGAGKGKTRRGRSERAGLEGRSDRAQLATAVAKLRRTRATAAAAKLTAEWEPSKWAEFLQTGKLGRVKLANYYLGKGAPRDLDNAQSELVATELFKDAVAVGAVVLPDSHVAEDFEFKILNDAFGVEYVNIALKSHPELRTAWTTDTYYLADGGVAMGARDLEYFFGQMIQGVDSLLWETAEENRR